MGPDSSKVVFVHQLTWWLRLLKRYREAFEELTFRVPGLDTFGVTNF